jgi:HK97 family phage major capsid protein
MPGSPRSLTITDAYRTRLNALADRLGALTLTQWQRVTLTDLDGSHADWLAATVAMLDAAQRAGVHLTAAYLASFIGSELGRSPFELPRIDETRFAGLAEDGQALEVPLGKTLIGVKSLLKGGKTPEEALKQTGARAVRLASAAVMAGPERRSRTRSPRTRCSPAGNASRTAAAAPASPPRRTATTARTDARPRALPLHRRTRRPRRPRHRAARDRTRDLPPHDGRAAGLRARPDRSPTCPARPTCLAGPDRSLTDADRRGLHHAGADRGARGVTRTRTTTASVGTEPRRYRGLLPPGRQQRVRVHPSASPPHAHALRRRRRRRRWRRRRQRRRDHLHAGPGQRPARPREGQDHRQVRRLRRSSRPRPASWTRSRPPARATLERLTGEVNSLKGQNGSLKAENMRLKVALKKGLTGDKAVLADRLSGATEAEMEADADELLKLFGGRRQRKRPHRLRRRRPRRRRPAAVHGRPHPRRPAALALRHRPEGPGDRRQPVDPHQEDDHPWPRPQHPERPARARSRARGRLARPARRAARVRRSAERLRQPHRRGDAGALMPEEVSNAFLKGLQNESAVLTQFTHVPVGRAQVRFPVLSALPVAYWVTGDTGLKQTTEVDWSNKFLNIEEIATIVPIPENVLDDAGFPIWDQVRPLCEQAAGRLLDATVFFGTSAPASFPTPSSPPPSRRQHRQPHHQQRGGRRVRAGRRGRPRPRRGRRLRPARGRRRPHVPLQRPQGPQHAGRPPRRDHDHARHRRDRRRHVHVPDARPVADRLRLGRGDPLRPEPVRRRRPLRTSPGSCSTRPSSPTTTTTSSTTCPSRTWSRCA